MSDYPEFFVVYYDQNNVQTAHLGENVLPVTEIKEYLLEENRVSYAVVYKAHKLMVVDKSVVEMELNENV